uniref:Glutathione S-transferase S14 n=1 Tax=Brachionus rotundiformis TaxID=96890 RepID=A0A3G2JSE7_9BILA|nr:glutathione S-transferase S14 [Brachionus rotundiformis]
MIHTENETYSQSEINSQNEIDEINSQNEIDEINPDDNKSEKKGAVSGRDLVKRNYKLSYFDFNGRGELLRLIFAVSNTDYIDERIKFEDWKEKKINAPLKQVPILKVDDEPVLVQSMAIARYLATEMNLAGRDNYEKTKVDFVLDLCKEFMDHFAVYVAPEILFPSDEKEEIIEDFLNKIAKYFLQKIQILIQKFGTNGYAVGNEITVADLFIYDLVTNMIKLDPFILENYPNLKENRNQVEENQNLQSYFKEKRKSRNSN